MTGTTYATGKPLPPQSAEPAPIPEDEDLLTMKDIVARTKMHRATIYRLIDAGTFPKGRATGPNSRRWTRREIKDWIG